MSSIPPTPKQGEGNLPRQQTSPTQDPFTHASQNVSTSNTPTTTKASSSFAEMAQSQGTTFSFRMDLKNIKPSPHKPQKTPGLLRIPGLAWTPTTRLSFDAGDRRTPGLPKISFGEPGNEPHTTSTRFRFGAMSLTPIIPYSSTPATTKASSSFAEMARSQGSTFSFRMAPHKPQKSPGLLRSPRLARLSGVGDRDYYNIKEGHYINCDPILHLSDKVDLKTGEEDESNVFSHRCKLYRFDNELGQWKERGIGDIKLLHNPVSGRYRIVMRRDKVFRVCANHYLNETMKLSANAGSDRSWVWQAMDASDGEPVPELLAIRFRTPETTAKFKDIFDAAIEDLKKDVDKGTTATDSTESNVTGGEDNVALDTSDVKSRKVSSTSDESKDVSSGAKPDEESRYTFTQALNFQNMSSNRTPTTTKRLSSLAEMAQSQGTIFSFRMNLKSAKPSPLKLQKSPGLPLAAGLARSPGGGDSEYYNIEKGDDIHFEPIVQLPDKVELNTGEEDESIIFIHRCDMYRFDNELAQWKERGIGDIKLLYNPTSGRYRIVMRRDKVFRVCANHYLNESMKLFPNAGSDRSWVWQAMDASNGEPVPELLAVRFKTPETAVKFKDIFDAATDDLKKNVGRSSPGATATDSTKSNVTGSEDNVALGTSGVKSPKVSSSKESKDVAGAETDGESKPMPKVETALNEIFKNSPTPPAAASSLTSDVTGKAEHNPEEEREIYLEPITHLPEKVDLLTGEENEIVLFCSYAKLYRFDAESKAWKDQGVGDIKILTNNATCRYRVIMRRYRGIARGYRGILHREQVLKVCVNHYITAAMKLVRKAGSKTSWVWIAMDASEAEPQFKKLAIKFKLENTAQKFKMVFEECQKKLEAGGEEEIKEESVSETQAVPSTELSSAADHKPSTQASLPSTASFPALSTSTTKTSRLEGGHVASQSDDTEEKASVEGANGQNLGASPDVIPKSSISPSILPKSESTLAGLLDDKSPFSSLFGDYQEKKSESNSETSASTSSSSSHSSSDEEEDSHTKDSNLRRLTAELRAVNSSHTRLLEENKSLRRDIQSSHNRIVEQNKTLMEKQKKLMDSNNALLKQIIDMNVSMSSDDLRAKCAAKPDEWNCDACCVRNHADKIACLGCNTPKPKPAMPSAAPAMNGRTQFGIQTDKIKMAMSNRLSAEEQKSEPDLAHCGICEAPFENPKALPCLHTFCLECLEQWAKGKTDKVKCPLCKGDFSLPPEGVSGFKSNFFISSLKKNEALKEELTQTKLTCNFCNESENVAVSWCIDCKETLCINCVKCHKTLKPLKGHNIYALDDIRSSKVNINTSNITEYCTKHKRQVLWFFCETCGVLICRDCTVVDHPASKHVLVNVEDISGAQGKRMGELSSKCQRVVEEVDEAIKVANDAENDLTVALRNARLDMTQMTAQIKDKYLANLKQKVQKLIDEMTKIGCHHKSQIKEQKDVLVSQKSQLKRALEMTAHITNNGSPYDVAAMYTTLTDTLQKLSGIKPAIVPASLSEVKFVANMDYQAEIPKLGTFIVKKTGHDVNP